MSTPSDPSPPEIQVLQHLRNTCTIFRRNASDIDLAKAILAEESRLADRIARLESKAPVNSSQEVPV